MSLSSSITPYLNGSVVLHATDPTGNTSVFFPPITGSFLNFGPTCPAHFDDSVSNLFVETWVTMYQNTVTMYITGVLTIATQTNDDWGLRCDGTYDRFMFYHYNTSGTSTSVLANVPLIRGQWYHVSVQFTSSGIIYLFINGILQNPGGTSIGGTPRYTPTSSLCIGTPAPSPDAWYALSGYVQDLRIIRGGVGPTVSYTPEQVPWKYQEIPPYVTNGTNVLSLAADYTTCGVLTHPTVGGATFF